MNPILQFLLGDGFGKIIDKIFPDPAQKAQAQLEMLKLQQDGEFKAASDQLTRDLAQIDVDKTEAQSPSFFRSGWRPAVGWVCVLGLGYDFLCQPLLSWYALKKGIAAPPQLDIGTLLTLLGGMLGLGSLRTTEKLKGIS